MNQPAPITLPYGVSADILIRNDVLQAENLSLQQQNAKLIQQIKEAESQLVGLQTRLEQMQEVLDVYALSLET